MLDDSDVSDDGDDQLFYQKLFLSGKYDAKLDYEGYLFQCNEGKVGYDGVNLYNPLTNCCPCIYHGNGGEEAKVKFDEIHTKIISEWTRKLFGVAISTTSTVRNLHRLDDYGLIEIVDNPHGKSHKFTWVKITAQGRRLQKLFIGSSSDWKDKPRTIVDKTLKASMSGSLVNDY